MMVGSLVIAMTTLHAFLDSRVKASRVALLMKPRGGSQRGSTRGPCDQATPAASSTPRDESPTLYPGSSSAACVDILAETIDQAVHGFLHSVRQGSVDGVAQSAFFISQSLVEAAERSRSAARNAGRVVAAAPPGDDATALALLRQLYTSFPAPSLSQWVSSLEELAAVALPAALDLMQQLHTIHPFHLYSSRTGDLIGIVEDTNEEARRALRAARQCLGALVNLCFLTTVAFRRAQTDADVGWQLLSRRESGMGQTAARLFLSGGGGGSDLFLLDKAALGGLLQRLQHVKKDLRVCFTRHLSLLLFSADQQLWSVKEEGTVAITGHPCLHQLPSTPHYVAEEDGWLWLLIAVTIHVLGPASTPTLDAAAASASLPPDMAAPSGVTPSRGAAKAAPSRRPAAMGGASGDGVAAGGRRTRAGYPVTLALVATANSPTPGGKDYAAKYLSVLLSALCLFLKLWMRQRALPSHVMDVWRSRGARFPSAEVTAEMLAQLTREMLEGMMHGVVVDGVGSPPSPFACDDSPAPSPPPPPPPPPSSPSRPSDCPTPLHQHCTIDDVSVAVECITDLVSNATPLFLHNAANFMELLKLLSTVGPMQLFYAVSGRQSRPAPYGVVRERRKGEGRPTTAPLRFAGKGVGRFMGAVTQLYRAASDHVLREALLLPASGGVPAPPEAATTILALGYMHVFCESVLAARAPPDGARHVTTLNASGSSYSAAAGVMSDAGDLDRLTRASCASWSRWLSVAFAVYMASDTAGSWQQLVHSESFARYCAGFTQSFGAALEDVFALVVVTKSAKTGGQPHDNAPSSLHDPVDSLGCLAVRWMRLLLRFLCDKASLPTSSPTEGAPPARPTSAAGCAHDAAIPFSCLTEESVNALELLLQRYEDVCSGAGDTPSHRQHWLLAIAYLRLSSADACCTSEAHRERGRGRVYPFAAYEGVSDYVCSGPRDSALILRDRTYETYDEWLKKEAANVKAYRRAKGAAAARPGQGGAAPADPFQLLRMEVKDACDVLRERLLMSAARFLCVALRLSSVREDRSESPVTGGAADSRPSSPSVVASAPGGVSADAPASHRSTTPLSAKDSAGGRGPSSLRQAKVYAEAFTRFLLTMDAVSSNRLMSCLRTFQEELRQAERQRCRGDHHTHHHLLPPSHTPSSPSPLLITDADVNEANLFEMEMVLFTV